MSSKLVSTQQMFKNQSFEQSEDRAAVLVVTEIL